MGVLWLILVFGGRGVFGLGNIGFKEVWDFVFEVF